MAEYRTIRMAFWNDPFVEELEAKKSSFTCTCSPARTPTTWASWKSPAAR